MLTSSLKDRPNSKPSITDLTKILVQSSHPSKRGEARRDIGKFKIVVLVLTTMLRMLHYLTSHQVRRNVRNSRVA